MNYRATVYMHVEREHIEDEDEDVEVINIDDDEEDRFTDQGNQGDVPSSSNQEVHMIDDIEVARNVEVPPCSMPHTPELNIEPSVVHMAPASSSPNDSEEMAEAAPPLCVAASSDPPVPPPPSSSKPAAALPNNRVNIHDSDRAYRARLSTFELGYPSTMSHFPNLSRSKFAKAGFIYVGPGDRVRCVECGATLENHVPTDNINLRHALQDQDDKKCGFLQRNVFQKVSFLPNIDESSQPRSSQAEQEKRRNIEKFELGLSLLILEEDRKYIRKMEIERRERDARSANAPTNNLLCNICLELPPRIALLCGHVYCYTCITHLRAKRNACCAFCRFTPIEAHIELFL